MSIRTLYCLAFLHVHLARKSEMQCDKALHVNYAMQIAGIAFLQCALAYQRPSIVLWQCLSECYELAKNEKLLDLTVKNSLTEFQALATSSNALKRVLLFWLINPYRFIQQDILTLFDFCTENCTLVNLIESGIPSSQTFCWEYKPVVANQPVYLCTNDISGHCVLFNTDALINFEQNQTLNIGAANLVIAMLDQYRFLLENTKFTLSSSYVFVSRFNSTIDFFVKHVRHHQILALNTPAPGDLNFSSLAMVKENKQHDYQLEKTTSADIWNYQEEIVEEDALKLKFGAMKLVQTSLPLFYVAQAMAVQLCAGDIFICYDAALKPAIGIARRVGEGRQRPIENSVVELFLGKVSLLQQTLLSINTKLSALLLENSDDKQLFIASANYEVGTVLTFDQQKVVLERLIEITSHIMRYKVKCTAIEG